MKYIPHVPVVEMHGIVAYKVLGADEGKFGGDGPHKDSDVMILTMSLIDENKNRNHGNVTFKLPAIWPTRIASFFVSCERPKMNMSGEIMAGDLINLTGYAEVYTKGFRGSNQIELKTFCDRQEIVKPNIDFDDFNKPLVTTNQQQTNPEPEADNFDDSDIPF